MVSYIFAHQVGFFLMGAVALFLAFVALIMTIFVWRNNQRLHKRLVTFCRGKDGVNLEETLFTLTTDVQNLDSDIQELFTISNDLHTLANRGLHKVAMLRFNPFKDLGGNQSFSLTMLDGKNNGIIISSLHTREGTRIYSKEVRNGTSPEHKLTEEEQRVLTQAKAQNIPPTSQKNA